MSTKNRVPNESGFSLVEMMICLAIVSLIFAATQSFHTGFPGNKRPLHTISQELIALLQLARSEAVLKNSTVTVEFDQKLRSFQIADTSSGITIRDATEVTLLSARIGQRSKQVPGIVFYPDGSSTGAEVRLRENQRLAYVKVDWLTGATSLDVTQQRGK